MNRITPATNPVMQTDAPLPDPPAPTTTQWKGKPCAPEAIHDRYPPIGTTDDAPGSGRRS